MSESYDPGNKPNVDPLIEEQRSALESESKRLKVGIGLAFVVLLGVIGYALLTGKPTADTGGDGTGNDTRILRVAVANDVKFLDPHAIDDIESGLVCDLIYERLVAFGTDENGAVIIEPELATYEIRDNGLVYEFTLRESATFHNGTKVTADTVIRSLTRVRDAADPVTGETFTSPYKSFYEGIAEMVAVDERTVRLVLTEPSTVFLFNLAMTPASIVAPEALDDVTSDSTIEVIGSGPWTFGSWVRQQALTIRRWDDYAGSRPMPKMGGIAFSVVSEAETRVNALLAGDADISASIEPTARQRIEQNQNTEVVLAEVANVSYLALCPNPTYKAPDGSDLPNPLADPRLREAIVLAIDKQQIVDIAFNGQAVPANSLLPPSLEGSPGPMREGSLEARRERARNLVAAVASEIGRNPQIALHNFPDQRGYLPDPARLAEAIAAQLRPIGFEVSLPSDNWQTYLDRSSGGQYPLCILGWQTDNGTSDNFLRPLVGTDAAGVPNKTNVAKWASEPLMSLLDRAVRSTDATERADLYRQAERIRHDAFVNVPIAHYQYLFAARANVRGFSVDPLGKPSFETIEIAPAE